MTKPTCDDVADLIDLYAAGECDPAQEKAVRTHLADCADCRGTLDESRRLLGLLDVHIGQDRALSRLGARLKAEARPARGATPRFVIHRFAAVAALLLVTFGLGVLLSPFASSPRPAPLQLALAFTEAKPDNLPAAVRSKEQKLELTPDGARLARAIARAKETGEWPLPPRVDLDLVVTNVGKTPIELDVGGPAFRWEVDLRGRAVERHAIPNPPYVPFPPRTLTIAPGGTRTLSVERLASQAGARVEYLYPTAPGDYVLRVRMESVARRGGVRETVRLSAGPATLRLP